MNTFHRFDIESQKRLTVLITACQNISWNWISKGKHAIVDSGSVTIHAWGSKSESNQQLKHINHT